MAGESGDAKLRILGATRQGTLWLPNRPYRRARRELVMMLATGASFYAHVFFDKEYHVAGSPLERFAWFRRMQQLHFVHHLHANSNFAVIDFFWDRILGTYRKPDGELH